MSKSLSTSRRDFIKISAAGAAAVAASSTMAAPTNNSRAAWTSPKPINPEIENLRVVFAHDDTMVNTSCSGFSNFGNMDNQNSYVEDDKIKENLDKMVIALTEKSNATSAWNSIFMKPASKAWSDVTVALKVNGIGVNHPRLAVVGKVCEELIRIGVTPGNITIYDACHGSKRHYDNYIGSGKEIPAGVVNNDGSSKYSVQLPDGSSMSCTDILVDGSGNYTKDIIVNLAVCKNHSYTHGRFTMTLKNHVGSLLFDCPTNSELSNISRCGAILGDLDDASTPARQQLCIIDALWASSRINSGPSATPDVDTSTLIMGTSSPIIDYLVAKKIRHEIVNDEPYYAAIENIVEDFGHNLNEVENLDMVDALDYQVGINDDPILGKNGTPKSLSLSVNSSVFKSTKIHFDLPGDNYISSLTVYDMKGKMVRNLMASSDGKKHREIIFDGKDNSGSYLAAGNYLINLVSGSFKKAQKLSLVK